MRLPASGSPTRRESITELYAAIEQSIPEATALLGQLAENQLSTGPGQPHAALEEAHVRDARRGAVLGVHEARGRDAARQREQRARDAARQTLQAAEALLQKLQTRAARGGCVMDESG